MNGLFFLLCCTEILSTLLCGASTEHENPLSTATSLPARTNFSTSVTETSAAMSRALSTQVTSKSPATSPPPVTQSTVFQDLFQKKDCLPLLMVTGGLMVVCTVLLVSTLLLACKVCHLARRVKGLSSNSDLISNTEYWTGSDKKGKSKAEAEPKETTVLMADISGAPAETGNGTKEEGGKATEGGQMGEEKEKEEVGDGEEASAQPVADADKSSPSKPQEEATDSQTTKAAAAPTSEGTGEPKDVV